MTGLCYCYIYSITFLAIVFHQPDDLKGTSAAFDSGKCTTFFSPSENFQIRDLFLAFFQTFTISGTTKDKVLLLVDSGPYCILKLTLRKLHVSS